MTANGWIQIALYLAIVAALTKPVGRYMTDVFGGDEARAKRGARIERVKLDFTGAGVP